MKIIKKADSTDFANSNTCYGVEYRFKDKDLDIARITIDGRYPAKGHLINKVIKEIIYVLGGSGVVGVGDKEYILRPGDAVFIKPKERYYLRGKSMRLLVPCSPAFYPEQHIEVS
jgi:mannose-6-phosphate isomerase-like protein (cupin superfamily)